MKNQAHTGPPTWGFRGGLVLHSCKTIIAIKSKLKKVMLSSSPRQGGIYM
jgi:hypothetical protein